MLRLSYHNVMELLPTQFGLNQLSAIDFLSQKQLNGDQLLRYCRDAKAYFQRQKQWPRQDGLSAQAMENLVESVLRADEVLCSRVSDQSALASAQPTFASDADTASLLRRLHLVLLPREEGPYEELAAEVRSAVEDDIPERDWKMKDLVLWAYKNELLEQRYGQQNMAAVVCGSLLLASPPNNITSSSRVVF